MMILINAEENYEKKQHIFSHMNKTTNNTYFKSCSIYIVYKPFKILTLIQKITNFSFSAVTVKKMCESVNN